MTKPMTPSSGAGMTLQEIADEMGISRQMVYKIEQRALTKARKAMLESGLTLEEILNGENRQIRGTKDTTDKQSGG